ARLLGYQNVLDVTVDDHGRVKLGDAVLLTVPAAMPGPSALAIWAAGLHISEAPAESGWGVASVRTGPGRVEVSLEGSGGMGGHLLVHLPWSTEPPKAGDRVQVTVSRSDAVLVPRRTSTG
ncbi:MAG: hypothetical protein ACRDV2_04350, partial [Actinomycetes bacterium]